MIYGEKIMPKNEGPACVDRRREAIHTPLSKSEEAPIQAVGER